LRWSYAVIDRPIVAIVQGDASGIGPELIAKLLADPETYTRCRPVVVGDAEIVAWGVEIAGKASTVRPIRDISEAKGEPGTIDVLDQGLLRRADLAVAGRVAAVAAAPTNKEARDMAKVDEGNVWANRGRADGRPISQMIGAGPLKAFNVTGHCAVSEVAALLSEERILGIIRLANDTLRRLGVPRPRIAVAGLNPHAGEHGLFGDDEARIIEPAIARARGEGIEASGPIPDDTLFVRAMRGEFDAEVCMYHAQSNVPVKMVDFGAGFSATCGLPFALVTTAHGTGYDIAGKGVASERSLRDALVLAIQFATAEVSVR
jgi:4-hydroxythreonine-4-phosphate dehydrogenase